jgi:hypothetical protein
MAVGARERVAAGRLRGDRNRGDDLDLDPVLRRGELRFDGGARGRLAGHHPLLPHRVHRGEIGHVRQVDRRRQDLRLVAAGFEQQIVDLREDLLRLSGDVRLGVVGDLSCEIRGARRVMDDEVGETLADVLALDGHDAILLW